jgi:regulator of sigma E protease
MFLIVGIIIAFIGLMSLLIIHEFGHFILAKFFGVKVEEFGLGLPPRIFGKKIGETIYSINAIPFGAFVKMLGEEEVATETGKIPKWQANTPSRDPKSFSMKPIWQRMLIVLGGVVSFWIVAIILLSIVAGIGEPISISDGDINFPNPKVQIMAVSENSPADKAGIEIGDTILKIKSDNEILTVDKIKQVQDFNALNKGKEITLTLERGKEVFEKKLFLRESFPEKEGMMGVALVRTSFQKYSWKEAPLAGVIATKDLTVAAVEGWIQIFSSLVKEKTMPAGADVVGPVGIFHMFIQMENLGAVYFLRFVAIVSIFLALTNILPIPALDGGKLIFLIFEGIKGKAVNPRLEQKITTAFFVLLICLLVVATIKDVIRIF